MSTSKIFEGEGGSLSLFCLGRLRWFDARIAIGRGTEWSTRHLGPLDMTERGGDVSAEEVGQGSVVSDCGVGRAQVVGIREFGD